MTKAEKLYQQLVKTFGIKEATGKIQFTLKDFNITVEQNNIVGNILEEWLDKWMTANGIPHLHNAGQTSPDFWLDPDKCDQDWLEVKSFTDNPNFDISAFRSFIKVIIDEPWKLHSDYLLLQYTMEDGVVTVKDCWLKKIWEISCSSKRWPVKTQYRNKVINNIRPATWYSKRNEFPTFQSLEHFLSAVEETIYTYVDTRTMAENWLKNLKASYKRFYGQELDVPRWMDIKHLYQPTAQ